MKPKLQSILTLGLAISSLFTASAHAYPVVDEAVPTAGLPIKVFKDHQNPSIYWYIPQSIEPWSKDGRYRSSLFQNRKVMSFVFRGQASVEAEMLNTVAKALGTTVDSLTPIFYDYSKDLTCQNIYAQDPAVSWLFPSRIGNYLEVIPVSLRVTNPELIEEISHHLTVGGGLACTVSVGFKAAQTGYKVHVTADFNKVYERFETAAHAEFFWWEVDVHSMVESLHREGIIQITSLEDASIPQTELDRKIQASMDEVVKSITKAMFTPALTLPNGPMTGRGKPWSLRADFRKSRESYRFEATLQSQKVQVKDTQISLRIATE